MPNRKAGQVLNCQWGYQWPLYNHTTGYVKIICPIERLYVWADNKAALA